MGEVEIRKGHNHRRAGGGDGCGGVVVACADTASPSEDSTTSGSRGTINTSTSTLWSDPQQGVFHHSITDLESFSNSLDINSHLPCCEEREEFLAGLMDEEEINANSEKDREGSFHSSFAYDMERSVPSKLNTIFDDFSEEEDEVEEEGNDIISDSANKVVAKA